MDLVQEAAKCFDEYEWDGSDHELALVLKEFGTIMGDGAWLARSYLSGEWKEKAA